MGLPTTKEREVLEILASGREMYGLEMINASSGSLKRGTIYVYLHRMEKEGILSSREEKAPGERGPARRKYQITALGRRALHAWQTALAIYAPKSATVEEF